ncbi:MULTISPECIES: hypothetical protein [unclassified Mycobacterium]|uniref:Vgb family protein n=1 Tax=unclassified Mycobacterium TaxID=2642494 RepID=UPI0029C8C615|nr:MULTISPECIES: hypothetical protein [unclassified Mycobacterium]
MSNSIDVAAQGSSLPPYTITEFPLPTCLQCTAEGGHACVGPAGLTFGPDGNLWFGMQIGPDGNGGIARMAPDGTGYTVYTEGLEKGSSVIDLALGADGNLWFADFGRRAIGRMTFDGVITRFEELTPGKTMLPPGHLANSLSAETISFPYEIVSASGDLWYTVQDVYAGTFPNLLTGYVGRFSPSDPTGSLQTYPLEGMPSGIVESPEGGVWVIHFHRWTDKKGGGITRITASGEVTTYPLPNPERDDPLMADYGYALTTAELTLGPDGNIWFTQEWCPLIGRFSPDSGAFDYFPLGDSSFPTHPTMLVTARDGYIYVNDDGPAALAPLEGAVYRLWRIATDGTATFIDGPAARGGLWPLTEAPNGDLWFAHRFGDVIGRLTIPD